MKTFILIPFHLLVLLIACQTVAEAQDAPRPNIIFIMADDLGYGDLSCYGQTNWQTPVLDGMAQRGLMFSDAYAGSTVCAPSRASLMTGMHNGHTWIRANGRIALRPGEDITIAQVLKRAGYHTAMIGKSSLACNSDDQELSHQMGFDYFFGFLAHAAAHHYYPKQLFRNVAGRTSVVEYPNNQLHEGEHYSSDLFLADTRAYLKAVAQRDEPFFLLYASQLSHASLCVPERWIEPFRGKFDEVSVPQRHYRGTDEPKATYAGMVTRLDWEVGQLLDQLEELGLSDNTLIIFMSDNGSMNEGGFQRAWFNSSGPLRGGKRDLYEGGIRSPMIAYWPGQIAPGKTDLPTANWDIFPTLAELAGAEYSHEIDGLSLVPTLLGSGEQPTHDYLYWEFHEQGGKQAVRVGTWKGVRLNCKRDADAPIELYDLSRDPGEANNIAARHPAVVRQIRRIMAEAREPHPRFPFAADRP
ncbi:MAG: arylsulfatase [Planctomycetota bacterium]